MTGALTHCWPQPGRKVVAPITEVLAFHTDADGNRFVHCHVQTLTGFVDVWRLTREITVLPSPGCGVAGLGTPTRKESA